MYPHHSAKKPSTKGCGKLAPPPRLTGVAAALFALSLAAAPAVAHDWQAKESCLNVDCAPVETMTRLALPGGDGSLYVIKSSRGSAVVPHGLPVRQSHDGRVHACLGYDPFGTPEVMCLFVPPRM
jgi:hypothetical protein